MIKLTGHGERFRAMVGVTDGLPERGSVEFIVSGDDKVVFDSGVVPADSRQNRSMFHWRASNC